MDLKGAEIRNFKEMGYIINDNSRKQHPLKVPHYQRPYKWKSENVEKLINDWFSHEENSDYFCGSIVTVTHDNKPHDLIDGQQRFTTLFLANFINFMILRSLVLSTLKYHGYSMRFMTLYEEMLDSLQYVIQLSIESNFSLVRLRKIKDRIMEELINKNYDAAIEIFNNSFSLKSLQSMIFSQNLILQYDRGSFNKSLEKVMCALDVNLENEKDISFSIDLDDIDISYTDNEKTYVEAIKTIFRSVKEKAISETTSPSHIKSIQMAISFKDIISRFIDEVKVCIVQTGNPDDAYTLFEVLNDRALALDDLDLIKNEFYKNYVLKSEADINDEEKDEVLQLLDNKWVNDIFNNTQDYQKKLITFLAVGYITGLESIKYDNSKTFREALKVYFKKYSISNPYSRSQIDRDFNILLACKSLMEEFTLKYQKKDLTALKVEYSEEVSASYKTIQLLYAKDQFGVLLGFTNFVLRNIESVSLNFDLNKVKSILESLKRPQCSVSDTSLVTIHNKCNTQAQNLWRVAIMSKDYKIPRDFAVKLIDHHYLNSPGIFPLSVSIELNDQLNNNFENWLRSWRYTSSSKNTLSIRILFARLIKMKLDNSTGYINKASIFSSINQDDVAEMQLDHIEPSNIDSIAENKYFKHIDRERFVNELGNMMPLPGAQNREKSNRPVMDGFKFFEAAGLQNHFILLQTKNLFDENNLLAVDSGNFYIPTEDFFEKRKELLIHWFKEIVKV